MFILAAYGYKQGQVYNINCQTAPLIDAIKKQAYADICSLLSTRQTQLVKEIEETVVKLEAKQKKLYRLENPPPEEEAVKSRLAPIEREAKPEDAEEVKKAEEAKETKEKEAKDAKDGKKPDPPRGKNDKNVKKEDPKKAGAKKPVVEEVKELTAEEIKQQKLEAEKEEVRKEISEIQNKKDRLNEKLELAKTTKEKYSVIPKEIDLVDQAGNRKYVKNRCEEIASSFLNTRVAYQVVIIEDNDSYQLFEIDGYCIRSVEDDANYIEEPKFKFKPSQKKK